MTRSNASAVPGWTWVPLMLLAACGQGPTINSFTATPDHVALGDSPVLAWELKDVGEVEISGLGKFPATQTTLPVNPTQTTTYTLTAKSFWGTSTATATITLVPKFQVRGGTYSGGTLGLTVAALLRDTGGAVPANDTVLTLTPPGSSTSIPVTCPGGRPLCLVTLPNVAPTSGSYSATATVAGTNLSTTFTVNAASRMPQVTGLSVQQAGAQTLSGSWTAAAGATSYRVQAVDLSQPTQPFGPVQVVSSTSATVSTSQAMSPTGSYALLVEASALDFALGSAPATLPPPNVSRTLGRPGSTPDGWQYLAPSAWTGNTLQISFNNLTATTERLAVLVLNVGGRENAGATVSVSGTTPLAPPPAELARSLLFPDEESGGAALRTPAAFHEALRQEEAQLARRAREEKSAPAPLAPPAPPAPAPATTTFCVRRGIGSPAVYIRKQATLKQESAHAVFYVDNDDTGQYAAQEPGIWSTLTSLWENQIYPGDTGTFGAESDVDANGKLTVFLSGELGQVQSGGILLGYFSPNDSYNPVDSSGACGGTAVASFQNKGSNHADMFFLNSLNNIVGAGAKATDIVNRVYPDTLAHEFQHLINFNQHCLLHRATCALEDTWINEGLSMVAEEIGGYGWGSSDGRRSGALYLDRLASSNPNLSYNGRSLTVWEGDPIGNYEGAHSFFRYYADRLGPSVLGQLVQTENTGLPNLESALGLPFDRAFAEWATALMLSNEPSIPGVDQFNFKGASWTPLHQKLRYLNYLSLNSSPQGLTLREDGWNALLTGAAVGSSAVVTITSTEAVKPSVVVIRLSNPLPRQ